MILETNLKLRYDQIYKNFITDVECNNLAIEPMPKPGVMRWGLSAVFKNTLPESVWQTVNELKPFIGQQQAYYTPQNIHLTIAELDAYSNDPSVYHSVDNGYLTALKETFTATNYHVHYHGMISTKSGLILCGYPQFDLQKARIELLERLIDANLIAPPTVPLAVAVRNSCHASLVVYSDNIENSDKYAQALKTLHTKDFGLSAISSLELVRFKRTELEIDLITMASL